MRHIWSAQATWLLNALYFSRLPPESSYEYADISTMPIKCRAMKRCAELEASADDEAHSHGLRLMTRYISFDISNRTVCPTAVFAPARLRAQVHLISFFITS